MGSLLSCSRSGQINRVVDMPDETQNRSVLTQETIGVCNLPTVVLEKIAHQLSWEDYGAFRQVNKRMSQSLLPVKAMNEKINQGLSGDRAEPYKKIVNAAKSDYITKEAHGAIRDALETIKVGRYRDLRNDSRLIALFCRYPHQRPGERAVVNVLDKFYRLMSSKVRIEHARVAHALMYSLIFLTCDDLKSAQQIFASAHQAFNQCKGGEKLVVASLINALKLHLCGRFAEADINNLAALYPDVFSMGEIIHKRYAPELNDVRWAETLFPFHAPV